MCRQCAVPTLHAYTLQFDAPTTFAKIKLKSGRGNSMPTYVTREEFEARVGVVEREIEGEKLVTRHILEQTRRNGDDLAAIKTRLNRVEEKVDGLDRKVDSLDRTVKDLIAQSRTWPRACLALSEMSCARSGVSAKASEPAQALANSLPNQ